MIQTQSYQVNHQVSSLLGSQGSGMFQTTCVSSDINRSPTARFEAENEATSQQSILLTINQVDLLMSLIKIILKTKTFI